MKILVVAKKDEPIVVEGADHVSTTKEALAALKKDKYDCGVIVHHSTLNSLDLTVELHQLLPLVILIDDVQIAETCLKIGALDYIIRENNQQKLILKAAQSAIHLRSLLKEIEFYRHLYTTAPVSFFSTDLYSGKFIIANPTCVRLLGFDTLEQLQQCTANQFYPADDRAKFVKRLKKVGIIEDFETELILPTKQKIHVSVNASLHGSQIDGSIADITERKTFQVQLERYKKEEMAKLDQLQDDIDRRLNS